MSDDLSLVVEGNKHVKVDNEADVWNTIMQEIEWQMFRKSYGKRVDMEIDDERVIYREGVEG
jgi:hypothetical protein